MNAKELALLLHQSHQDAVTSKPRLRWEQIPERTRKLYVRQAEALLERYTVEAKERERGVA
jgi:hypothetical protein